MSAMPKDVFSIPCALFPSQLYFVQDRATFVQCFKAMDCDVDEPRGAGRCSSFTDRDGDHVAVIFAADTATLVHEICHAVRYVLENAGVKLDPVDDETFAYLAAWMWRALYPQLKSCSRPKKRTSAR